MTGACHHPDSYPKEGATVWLTLLKQFMQTEFAQGLMRKFLESLFKNVPAGASASVSSFTPEQLAEAAGEALDSLN